MFHKHHYFYNYWWHCTSHFAANTTELRWLRFLDYVTLRCRPQVIYLSVPLATQDTNMCIYSAIKHNKWLLLRNGIHPKDISMWHLDWRTPSTSSPLDALLLTLVYAEWVRTLHHQVYYRFRRVSAVDKTCILARVPGQQRVEVQPKVVCLQLDLLWMSEEPEKGREERKFQLANYVIYGRSVDPYRITHDSMTVWSAVLEVDRIIYSYRE